MAKSKKIESVRIVERVGHIPLENLRPNPYQPESRIEVTEEVPKRETDKG
jgi:hypothetical protein